MKAEGFILVALLASTCAFLKKRVNQHDTEDDSRYHDVIKKANKVLQDVSRLTSFNTEDRRGQRGIEDKRSTGNIQENSEKEKTRIIINGRRYSDQLGNKDHSSRIKQFYAGQRNKIRQEEYPLDIPIFDKSQNNDELTNRYFTQALHGDTPKADNNVIHVKEDTNNKIPIDYKQDTEGIRKADQSKDLRKVVEKYKYSDETIGHASAHEDFKAAKSYLSKQDGPVKKRHHIKKIIEDREVKDFDMNDHDSNVKKNNGERHAEDSGNDDSKQKFDRRSRYTRKKFDEEDKDSSNKIRNRYVHKSDRDNKDKINNEDRDQKAINVKGWYEVKARLRYSTMEGAGRRQEEDDIEKLSQSIKDSAYKNGNGIEDDLEGYQFKNTQIYRDSENDEDEKVQGKIIEQPHRREHVDQKKATGSLKNTIRDSSRKYNAKKNSEDNGSTKLEKNQNVMLLKAIKDHIRKQQKNVDKQYFPLAKTTAEADDTGSKLDEIDKDLELQFRKYKKPIYSA